MRLLVTDRLWIVDLVPVKNISLPFKRKLWKVVAKPHRPSSRVEKEGYAECQVPCYEPLFWIMHGQVCEPDSL